MTPTKSFEHLLHQRQTMSEPQPLHMSQQPSLVIWKFTEMSDCFAFEVTEVSRGMRNVIAFLKVMFAGGGRRHAVHTGPTTIKKCSTCKCHSFYSLMPRVIIDIHIEKKTRARVARSRVHFVAAEARPRPISVAGSRVM